MKRLIAHVLCCSAAGLAFEAAQPAWADEPDALVGDYNGGQVEVAAGLRLGADGRFMYGMAYGALDEQAQGTWQRDGDCAVLTSDPVTAPVFRVVESKPLPAHELRLELRPSNGIDPQYFDYALVMADGTGRGDQVQDGAFTIELGDEAPRQIFLSLPIFDLRSQPFEFPATGGLDLVVAFDANDLGKVAFDGERLCPDGKGLRLARYDLELHFRRVEAGD
ncbi:hypothetical protein GRI89_07570 [Altererythrobacter salegens]|uniref:Uncharacterized protein n=1 Tax=Croceibacterium salegens TaxID=1737568 RepID=A0A6I4SWI6_9SPHN|nr:hypothetical protein [Croceibacterium salegens]MXO59397.1 hypothetical protein [Croceibacterium salegens]